ncbi:septum formation initiator family protein [Shouchella shacheensis]|uniref:septum formation initiator family protein n=1 Tax=Shouchella shacheensis TaxID=1649580 RepID=UPI000A70E192|nr:septum formation initiator family protein [Shouchella shacheensis]
MITKRERASIKEIDTGYMEQRQQELERQARRRKGLRRRLGFLVLLFAVMVGTLAVTLFSQSSTIANQQTYEEELGHELSNLEEEESQLLQDIENYNDEEYIAEIARRDYLLTFPGETLYTIPD